MANMHKEDIERTQVNDLRVKDYVVLPGNKLMKIKEIKKSKTGKHGGCKVHLKGVDVFSCKNVDHMVNSSDDMDKIKPRKTVGWTLVKICDDDDEPSVILENKKLKREVTLKPSEDDFEFLQNASDDEQDVDVTLLEFGGKLMICRTCIAKQEKSKRK